MPQSDAHLVLAQAKGGLSCFFLPRLLPGGEKNALHIERLKEKLGNRSNASAEVEFFGASGWLIGEEGEGVRQILKMGGYTRFDCALGSHAMMRRAFSVALYHAHQRQVLGKNLLDQPLMRQLLCSQALVLEGQTALLMRLARAWSRGENEQEKIFSRLFTPTAKYTVCKRGIGFVAESMEVLGGIGYCEESELPRLYREMPVNSIWEGSGNVMCLDVLRALTKQPGMVDVLSAEFDGVKGQNRHFDSLWRQIKLRLAKPQEAQAHSLCEGLFALACGVQVMTSLEPGLADAWCRQMLDRRGHSRLAEPVAERLLLRATGVKGPYRMALEYHRPGITVSLTNWI